LIAVKTLMRWYQRTVNVHSQVHLADGGGTSGPSTARSPASGFSETHRNGRAAIVAFRYQEAGIDRMAYPLLSMSVHRLWQSDPGFVATPVHPDR